MVKSERIEMTGNLKSEGQENDKDYALFDEPWQKQKRGVKPGRMPLAKRCRDELLAGSSLTGP